MSRVGKEAIELNDKVIVSIEGSQVKLKSGKYEKHLFLKGGITAEQKNQQIIVKRTDDEAQSKAYHGLFRSLIQNFVIGISQGWQKTLELKGVGYKAQVSGKILKLNLGYSHPIEYNIPQNIEIKVNKQTQVVIQGPDKEQVGQVAAHIRSYRVPEPYLGKGVRYSDEVIRRKAGKSATKGK